MSHDYPACATFRGGLCTCDAADDLPHCDCLNECGDDGRVADGRVKKCFRYDQVQRDMWQWQTAAALQNCMTPAAADVLRERRRQVEDEGYDLAHDDAHVNDEIAAAACFYAMPPGAREWDASSTGYGRTLGLAIIPEGWTVMEGDRRRELVKAGALILAEIERLDRAAG